MDEQNTNTGWARAAGRAPGLMAALLLACGLGSESGPSAEAVAAAADREVREHRDSEPAFASTALLLRAVRDGELAEHVSLPERPVAPTPPDPLRIAFARGTALADGEREALSALAARLLERDRLVVDVVGCSDPSGSEALNRRVSRARADRVVSELRELGVPPDRIGEIEGRGEDCEVPERVVQVVPRAAPV